MICPACQVENDRAVEVCSHCSKAVPSVAPTPDRRRETRLETPLNVQLKRLDAGGAVLEEERTIANNVSRKGVEVMTAMASVSVGDWLMFEEVGTDFTTRAVVRGKRAGAYGVSRLGLEFLDQHAPDRLVATGEWKSAVARERPRREATAPPPPPVREERRTITRLEVPLEVVVTRIDASGAVVREERTTADNLSRGGARVMTAFHGVSIGEVVRLAEVGGDFETRAEIRNTYVGDDRIRRLNLQFLDRQAPNRLVRTDDVRSETPPAGRSEPRPSPPQAPPVAEPAVPSPELLARRQQIVDAYGRLGTSNHFELLGIPRASGEAQVREAYHRMARVFHPDTAGDAALADLAREVSAVMIRLGDAYKVLSDPKRRSAYEEFLGPSPRKTRPPWAAATPSPKAAPQETAPPTRESPAAPPTPSLSAPPAPFTPPTEDEAREAAERDVLEAQSLIAEEKNWDAIQILERVLPPLQGQLKQRAQVLLARAVLRNPKWVKRAEEILQSVVQEDRDNVEAHVLLGTLYKKAGLKNRADRMLRRVLQLDPFNRTAIAALGDRGEGQETWTP